MDYIALFKRAWHITFKYKFLWLFGLFLGISANFTGGTNYNFEKEESTEVYKNLQNFLAENFIWLIVLSSILLALFLIFIFLRIASEGALISSINQVEEKEEINLARSFKLGLHYFWKILAIKFLFGFSLFVAFIIIGAPTAILFILNMPLRGFVLLLLGLIIFIPLFIIFSFIIIFSLRFAVIKKQRVIKAIKSGFKIFRENIGPTLITFLILFGINAVTSIILILFFLFLILIFGVPSLILGGVLYSTFGLIIPIILLYFGVLIFISTSFLINAILNTYNSALWTLTFRKIVKN